MKTEDQRRAALRAARKERLAGMQGGSSDGGSVSRSSGSMTREASNTRQNLDNPVPTGKGKVLTASVVDPALVDPAANMDLVPFGENTENPHWVGFINGEPAFKIAFADQPEAFRANPKMRKAFIEPQYARTVKEARAKLTLPQILQDVNARVYTASVLDTEAYKAIEKRVVQERTAAFQKKAATVLDDFTNVLGLVTKAQAVNYLQEQPLKAALFRALEKVGIANPLPVIEEAMTEGMVPHLDGMFVQAQHWMGLHPEALADLKDTIQGMDHRMPAVTADTHPELNQRLNAVPTARGNVQLTSVRGSDPGGERTASADPTKEHLKNVFNFGGRARNHLMQPR
jgi:hypothetical protein